MIPEPTHGRKLVIGGVALVKFRFPKSWRPIIDRLRSQYEARLTESKYFSNAPFTGVNLVVRYGAETRDSPSLMRVARRSGDLELSIEINVDDLIGRKDEVVETLLSAAIARALNAVREKYETPRVEPV